MNDMWKKTPIFRQSRAQTQRKFADLPGASRIDHCPDVQAFDEKTWEEGRTTARWENEGGKS
jgi:hypothetical protein